MYSSGRLYRFNAARNRPTFRLGGGSIWYLAQYSGWFNKGQGLKVEGYNHVAVQKAENHEAAIS